MALNMECYLDGLIWRKMVSGPAFPNLCNSLKMDADHLARYARPPQCLVVSTDDVAWCRCIPT